MTVREMKVEPYEIQFMKVFGQCQASMRTPSILHQWGGHLTIVYQNFQTEPLMFILLHF